MGIKGNKICHENDINEGFFYLNIKENVSMQEVIVLHIAG